MNYFSGSLNFYNCRKVRTAKKRGVPVVSHRWLSSCLERWQKVNKDDFLLECDEMPVKSSPLSAGDALSEQSNALGVKSISSMDVISHQMLKDMDQEVLNFFCNPIYNTIV
jgi:hypothetical protein